MMFTVLFSSRISPFTSTVIFFVRSPLATALVTSAMLRTWDVRLPAIRLTLSVRSFHVPATPRTSACPPSLPSVPTSLAPRVPSARDGGGRPAPPRAVRLPAQLAFRAHFPRHAGPLGRERGELVHHRVDGVLQLQDLAL